MQVEVLFISSRVEQTLLTPHYLRLYIELTKVNYSVKYDHVLQRPQPPLQMEGVQDKQLHNWLSQTLLNCVNNNPTVQIAGSSVTQAHGII
jgi:hypothetical protein